MNLCKECLLLNLTSCGSGHIEMLFERALVQNFNKAVTPINELVSQAEEKFYIHIRVCYK